MKRRLFAAVLAVCMALSLLPTTALADASGKFENGITWEFTYLQNPPQLLTITGSGPMPDFQSHKDRPWYNYPSFTVKFVGGVTKIGATAFSGANLVGVTLPDGLFEIGNGAFYDTNITSLDLPGSVTTIGSDAFAKCPIEQIRFGYGLRSISDRAFQSCDNLSEVSIPNGITMGKSAFSLSRGLQRLSIGNNVGIGDHAFSSCSALKDVVIGNDARIGLSAFYDCQALESVRIGRNAALKSGTFSLCANLKTAVLGDGLTEIPSSMFKGDSSLISVTIPASVKKIGLDAFDGCSSLETVYYGGSEKDWNAMEINKSNGSISETSGNNPLLKAKIVWGGVSVTDVTPGVNSNLVRVSPASLTALLSATGGLRPVVFAAFFNGEDPRPAAIASGYLNTDSGDLIFSRDLAGSAKFFFLHPITYAPLFKPTSWESSVPAGISEGS